MSKRNLKASRSNRKLVIESATARNSISSDRSSTLDRRRPTGLRRDPSRQEYSPNKNSFGGMVSTRSQRLLVKAQYETNSSAIPYSDPHNEDNQNNIDNNRNSAESSNGKPMPYPYHQMQGLNGQPPHYYPPGMGQQTFPPQVLYASQAVVGTTPGEDAYQAFLNRQYQINEMQRQEELRKAEHERRLAETLLVQQQQKELELKNAAAEQEKLREEEEEFKRLEMAEHLREKMRDSHDLYDPLNPPKEVYLSNDDLIAELRDLKKKISASSQVETSDDELLEMFSRLQILQDILEKRDVEIDAALLLARSFRRQSGRRKSDHENNTSRNRRSSLEKRSSNNNLELDIDRTLSRRNSSESIISRSYSRQGSMDSVPLDDIFTSEERDEFSLEESAIKDPRVSKLEIDIAELSNSILCKSVTDSDLLAMFDQLDGLKRELAALKGIELPPAESSENLSYNEQSTEKRRTYEAAELQVNPHYREIKKLKPVLRRLLPSRTQFAKIEELFNCDVEAEHGEVGRKSTAKSRLSMINEEEWSDDEDFDDDYDYNDNMNSVHGNYLEAEYSNSHHIHDEQRTRKLELEAISESSSDCDDGNAHINGECVNDNSGGDHRESYRKSEYSNLTEEDRFLSEDDEIDPVEHMAPSFSRLSNHSLKTGVQNGVDCCDINDEKHSIDIESEANLEYQMNNSDNILIDLDIPMEHDENATRDLSIPSEGSCNSPIDLSINERFCNAPSDFRQSYGDSSAKSRFEDDSICNSDGGGCEYEGKERNSGVVLQTGSPIQPTTEYNDVPCALKTNTSPHSSDDRNVQRISPSLDSIVDDDWGVHIISTPPLEDIADDSKDCNPPDAVMSQRNPPVASRKNIKEVKKPLKSIKNVKPDRGGDDRVSSAVINHANSEKPLSMESRNNKGKGRAKSGFLMGNPMGSPRPSTESCESSSSANSTSSISSMDRLPHGVNSYRKANLDIFQSRRK